MKSEGSGHGVAPQPHERLVAWQRAMDLLIAVHGVADRFPAHQRSALADQIRRAAVSIPSNIAEGNGRESDRASLQYCLIAHGSLREVETQLVAAHRLGYIDADRYVGLRLCCEDAGGALRGLIAHLRRRVDGRGVREDDPTPYDIGE